MVKIDESGSDTYVHEMITTFFESEWKLHGQEASGRDFFYFFYFFLIDFLL
jgi:hypothetical protein